MYGSGNATFNLDSGQPNPPFIPFLSTPSETLTVELSAVVSPEVPRSACKWQTYRSVIYGSK